MSEQLERISSTLEQRQSTVAQEAPLVTLGAVPAAAVPAAPHGWRTTLANPCGGQWSNQLDWENKCPNIVEGHKAAAS